MVGLPVCGAGEGALELELTTARGFVTVFLGVHGGEDVTDLAAPSRLGGKYVPRQRVVQGRR